jgi:hypothetical protein
VFGKREKKEKKRWIVVARQRNNFWGINKLSSALFRSWSRPWPWYKGEDGSLQALKNIREKKRKKWGKKNKETRTEFVTVRRQQLSGWKQTPSTSRKTEGGLRERERDKKTEAHWLPTKTLHQTLATHGHASAAVDPGNARAESS